MTVELRKVVGFENFFATSEGKIATNVYGEMEELDHKVNKYGDVEAYFNCNEFKVMFKVTSAVAEAFGIDPKDEIVHIDGNRANDAVSNLIGKTKEELRLERAKNKVGNREYVCTALDETLVKLIGKLWNENKMNILEIASILGKDRHTVSDVVTGKTWGHLGITFEER